MKLRSLKFFFVTGLTLLAIAFIGGYFLANHFIRNSNDRLVPLAAKALARVDVSLQEAIVSESEVTPLGVMRWRDVHSVFDVGEGSPLARKGRFDAVVGKLELAPTSLSVNEFEIRLEDMMLKSVYLVNPVRSPDVRDVWIHVDHLSRKIPFSLDSMEESLRSELEDWKELARVGVIEGDIAINAQIGFVLEGLDITLHCKAETREGGTGLRADRADIERLATLFSKTLTAAEIDVVSKYPLQAPYMLYLHEYAALEAVDLSNRDSRVSRDAYRHLLWSFLLTKRFGPNLAEEITDAHEIGSLTNTEADHRMDYNNNEVGRRYALGNVQVEDIAHLVYTDPEVIQYPR